MIHPPVSKIKSCRGWVAGTAAGCYWGLSLQRCIAYRTSLSEFHRDPGWGKAKRDPMPPWLWQCHLDHLELDYLIISIKHNQTTLSQRIIAESLRNPRNIPNILKSHWGFMIFHDQNLAKEPWNFGILDRTSSKLPMLCTSRVSSLVSLFWYFKRDAAANKRVQVTSDSAFLPQHVPNQSLSEPSLHIQTYKMQPKLKYQKYPEIVFEILWIFDNS